MKWSKSILKHTAKALLVAMAFVTLMSPIVATAQTPTRLAPDVARKMVIDRLGGGIVQKIEYAYDDTKPQYKGEALIKGKKIVFELNANDSTWAKWDVGNSNDWDEIAPVLPSIKTMDQAAASVIQKSGNPGTFIQKIDYLHDSSEPMYQGEAFYTGVKYSFEIDAKTGAFKKFDVSRGDETFVEKYWNVAPSGGAPVTTPPTTTQPPATNDKPITEPAPTTPTTPTTPSTPTTPTAPSALRLAPDVARQMVIERLGGGIVQKIEYAYDDTNPHYKGEALIKGKRIVFELNAANSTWSKWDVGNSNDWDEIAPILSSIITMDQAAANVIQKSGNAGTFIQKIDYLHDSSEPIYQGEAFYIGVKYSFEIYAKTGEFKKFDISRGDETFVEKYANVAPSRSDLSGSGGATPAGVKETRLSGDNRYKTAVAISKQRLAKADVVLLANGISQIDALTAAPYAQMHKAPLLLTGGKSLEGEVKAEIGRLGATKVILIGGTGSIDPSIDQALRSSGLIVERVQGSNRYQTSAVLASKLGSKPERVFLVNGISAVDALGIGPYAAQNGIPVLLTNGNDLDDEVENMLASVRSITVIGGEGSVKNALVDQLRAKGIAVERIFGSNRYQTSVSIAKTYYKNADVALFATGEVLADGLTGTGLAADLGAPLLLVKGGVSAELSAYLKTQSILQVFILGGTGSVPAALVQALIAASK